MKRKFVLILYIMISAIMAYSATGSEGKDSSNNGDFIIVIRKDKKRPGKYMPPIQMEVVAHCVQEELYLDFPFDEYPISVNIAKISPSYNYWQTTLYNPTDGISGFIGENGYYEITITSTEGNEGRNTYTGSFSIE